VCYVRLRQDVVCYIQAFADDFNKRLQGKSWRITNMSDIVPRWVLYVAAHRC